MSLVNTMNQQRLLVDKKREGRSSVVHFGKWLLGIEENLRKTTRSECRQ